MTRQKKGKNILTIYWHADEVLIETRSAVRD
jgi:hypothetical protein